MIHAVKTDIERDTSLVVYMLQRKTRPVVADTHALHAKLCRLSQSAALSEARNVAASTVQQGLAKYNHCKLALPLTCAGMHYTMHVYLAMCFQHSTKAALQVTFCRLYVTMLFMTIDTASLSAALAFVHAAAMLLVLFMTMATASLSASFAVVHANCM